jgi:hypothetical protein
MLTKEKVQSLYGDISLKRPGIQMIDFSSRQDGICGSRVSPSQEMRFFEGLFLSL